MKSFRNGAFLLLAFSLGIATGPWILPERQIVFTNGGALVGANVPCHTGVTLLQGPMEFRDNIFCKESIQ